MTLFQRLASTIRGPFPALARYLFALATALFLLVGGSFSAAAGTPPKVAFPAAAGIKPIAQPVGPVENIAPITNGVGIALVPNDVIGYDYDYTGSATLSQTGGAFLNFSVHGNSTTGTDSVLASSSVGSGEPFGASLEGTAFAVAPSGLVYYFYNNKDLVEINPVTGVRTVRSVGSNSALGPVPAKVLALTWDFATSTVIYYDASATAQGATSGFYRVDPATGIRTAISLYGGSPGSGILINGPQYLVTDPYGNLFYLERATPSTDPQEVAELPISAAGSTTYGARKIVSNTTVGSHTSGNFIFLAGLTVDNSQAVTLTNGLPVVESLLVTDEGDTQTDSAIYRVPTDTGNHNPVITFNGTNANTGSATFDLPISAVADTTGRIYYDEGHNASYPFILNDIATGTHAAVSLTGAENLSIQEIELVTVPPPVPTLAVATVSNNTSGTSVTLNGSVTADGGVANTGILSRGFVYALTSVNSTPKIGGTGVTRVSNFQATSAPVTQNTNLGAFTSMISSLTAGTSYTFSVYAEDAAGFTYTAPAAFTTAAAPAVTTNAATAITGVSATLGGNVTSDGGGGVSARGLVYSSSNQTPLLGGSGVTNIADASATTGTYTDGTGNVLANGTTYYFRAYASNGVGTTYGSILTFKTIAAPTANAQSVTTALNTAKAVTLTGSDPNSPAQTLTYTVTAQPIHGTLSGTAPNLTYTPTAGYNGADSFQFTTTNTSGLTSTAATVSITVTAGIPTANNQNVGVPFNTATAITPTATDPDSPAPTLTYTVVTAPTHGTLSGTAPNLTYTPTANYQGADNFTFHVSNGTNTSNAATVSIMVAAGTPTANSQSVSAPFNTAVGVTLTGSDPDSPALALTYTVVTAPTHGTLSGTSPNLTYTPAANYQGADSFTFQVSNGQNTSSAATVSITVSAGTPTANPQAVNVNFNLPATVILTGADPDSPALALTYTVVTQPSSGTLSGTAPNLTYTPNTSYTGSDSFTFTVNNGQKTSVAATVSLTVIGEPTISTFSPALGAAGTTVTIIGTNLQNATGLTFFRNVAGTSFAVVSSTQITVAVPAGAKTGLLTVFTGSGSNSSSTKFTVTSTPAN